MACCNHLLDSAIGSDARSARRRPASVYSFLRSARFIVRYIYSWTLSPPFSPLLTRGARELKCPKYFLRMDWRRHPPRLEAKLIDTAFLPLWARAGCLDPPP